VLTKEVLARCRELGFALAGVAPAQPSRWREEVLAWLAAGRHGEMKYLAEDLELRFEPGGVLTGAKAFIMVADVYANRGQELGQVQGEAGPGKGRIARYAQGRNYHDVMKKRLHGLSDELRARYPGSKFRTFVDTVPVLERELAILAGLGWQAKNTMVINPRLGSYLLLGGVATTLELEPPPDQPRVGDHCGTCTRCIDACPTQAITPYSVDGSRCISYLTIEHRQLIDPSLHGPMGDWIYGCDICQEVCPHNSPRLEASGEAHPAYAPQHDSFDLLEVLGWDAAARQTAFRSSAMKRATLAMMKRNALIALGNLLARRTDARVSEALARISQIAEDQSEPDLVRTTARQVSAQMMMWPASAEAKDAERLAKP
jgi:epoxyqueuosine reductase